MFDEDVRSIRIAHARMLRLSVVRGSLFLGRITIEEGKALLNANLTPGDDDTYYDDSLLLEETEDEIIDAVWPDLHLEN